MNENDQIDRRHAERARDALWERINAAHDAAKTAQGQLNTHELLCAQRQTAIINRIIGLENVVRWAAGGLIAGMLAVLAGIVFGALKISGSG